MIAVIRQGRIKVQNFTIVTENSYGPNCFREFAVLKHSISLNNYFHGAITTDANDVRPVSALKETSFKLAQAFGDHDLLLHQADYRCSWHLSYYYYCPCLL